MRPKTSIDVHAYVVLDDNGKVIDKGTFSEYCDEIIISSGSEVFETEAYHAKELCAQKNLEFVCELKTVTL